MATGLSTATDTSACAAPTLTQPSLSIGDLVRDVVGSEGVKVGVSYAGGAVQTGGTVHGQQSAWAASGKFNVQPSSQAGWQLAQFVFVAGGTTSEFEIYDFYVDPRMH